MSDLLPPRPAPSLKDGHTALARQVAVHLWEVASFQLARRAVQYHLGIPPDSKHATSFALGAAHPQTPVAIRGLDDQGIPVDILPQPRSSLTDYLAHLAGEHLTLAGFPEPTPRLILWGALALIWPANSVEEIVAVLPIIPEITLNRTTGAITKGKDRSVRPKVRRVEDEYVADWEERLTAERPAWPELDWTPRGAPQLEQVDDGWREITREAREKKKKYPWMTWEDIARSLRLSPKNLYLWRRLLTREERGE